MARSTFTAAKLLKSSLKQIHTRFKIKIALWLFRNNRFFLAALMRSLAELAFALLAFTLAIYFPAKTDNEWLLIAHLCAKLLPALWVFHVCSYQVTRMIWKHERHLLIRKHRKELSELQRCTINGSHAQSHSSAANERKLQP